MFKPSTSLVLLSLFTCLSADGRAQEERLPGFSASSTRAQKEWEQAFRALPDAKLMREAMQRLTAHPHHVGSPYGKDNAEWMLAKLKDWGLDARDRTLRRAVSHAQGTRWSRWSSRRRSRCSSTSRPLTIDPTSNQKNEQLPTYNAYSVDGDVTAPLVYVNYGLPDDYEQLDRLGISVKGAIVIARYGNSWRGIKPKVAAEHGAVGCIIYSDPRDDGYFGGDVFPAGPMRPKDGVQRGSVMDAPLYPGDPLTPGVGATPSATAPRPQGRGHDHEDPRPADLLRRRAAAARPRSRAPWRRWSGAARCPSPTTSAQARRRCTCGCSSTGT